MKLTIPDRILLLDLIPSKFDYAMYLVKTDILKKLAITQEEHTELNVKYSGQEYTEAGKTVVVPPNEIAWNKADYAIDVEFSEVEKNLFRTSLEDMDRRKALTDQYVKYFLVFVKGEEIEEGGA